MLGLIELLLVLAVVLGWAVLDLRGLRKDRRGAAPKPGGTAPDAVQAMDQSVESRHPEGQQGSHPGGSETIER